jgi:hypothetical protein
MKTSFRRRKSNFMELRGTLIHRITRCQLNSHPPLGSCENENNVLARRLLKSRRVLEGHGGKFILFQIVKQIINFFVSLSGKLAGQACQTEDVAA